MKLSGSTHRVTEQDVKVEGWTEGTVGRREDGGLGGNGTLKEVSDMEG